MGYGKTGDTLLQKTYDTFDFEGVYRDVLGTPEKGGIWIIYGKEKHGKTQHALKLAEMLSKHVKVNYASGEEGLSYTFSESYERAQLDPKNKRLKFYDAPSIEEIDEGLGKRNSAKAVFIDNETYYRDELKYGVVRELHKKYKSKKLFIYICHEERGEPDGATSKLIRKLANVVMRVEGLNCFVSGRCPGGIITINEEKAEVYHGKLTE